MQPSQHLDAPISARRVSSRRPSESNIFSLRRKPDRRAQPRLDREIAGRAYALFEARGCVHGHDVEDWLAAEAELLAELTRVP